jgi:VWFA-related protein
MALTKVSGAIGRVSFVALFLLFLLSPLFLTNLHARQSQNPSGPVSIRSTSDEVSLYAIVRDGKGRMVSNLNKGNFELREDGAVQQIQYFARETNVPLSLGVLIDTSPSQGQLLAKEQDSAKLFLQSVLQKADQAFVIHFDVDVEVLQDFTNEAGSLSHALDQMQINTTGKSVLPATAASTRPGATRLYDAVYLASNELMKTRYGRKVLVLITDGEDQGSTVDWKSSLEAAEKADVIVYSIVINDPDFYLVMGLPYRGSAAMQKLSLATGGSAIRVASVQNIGAAFDQIAGELHSEYLLSYSPTNSSHSGAFREIRLRVPGHRYAVRARRGYYGPAE